MDIERSRLINLGRIALAMGLSRLHLIASIDHLTTPRVGAAGAASTLLPGGSARELMDALVAFVSNAAPRESDVVLLALELQERYVNRFVTADSFLSLPLTMIDRAEGGVSVALGVEESKGRFRSSGKSYSNDAISAVADDVEAASSALLRLHDLVRLRCRMIPTPDGLQGPPSRPPT